MVVYPSAFVLAAAAAGAPLSHSRILWQNWLRDLPASSVSASSEASGFPKDAPLRENTHEAWRPTALPATLTFTLGQARAIEGVGIFGTLGSSGCSLKIETSTDGAAWSLFSAEVAPGDDAPILALDELDTASFLRLTVAAGSGASALPKLAVGYAGPVLAMERSIYAGHSPITLSRETELAQSMSKSGNFLGSAFRRKGVTSSMAFKHLTPAWYRANFDPFVRHARALPYFAAWRPLTYPLEVGYVWTDSDIVPSNSGVRDWMQVSWKMRGVGYE